MTSSLVGSEMCIRDSGPTACRGTNTEAMLPKVATERSSVAASHAPAIRAVSYTHLTLPTICSV
eukprot:6476076-Prorocentrum_lima.AAC.1